MNIFLPRSAVCRLFVPLVFPWALLCALSPAFAQTTDAPPQQLPPMIVEETKDQPRWLYASAGGTEYLSLCSTVITRRYIESHERMMQLVRLLVPAEFLLRSDAPGSMVLYSQDRKRPPANDAALRALLGARDTSDPLSLNRGTRDDSSRYQRQPDFAPNLRLDDRDTFGAFAYIDETNFDGSILIVSPGYVRYLMERRVPLLPAWLIEGVDRVYRTTDFVRQPVTFRAHEWLDRFESANLAVSDDRPRGLLPAVELFAPDSLRSPANRHPQRVATLRSEVALFYRWALDSGSANREALWKFVARASAEPITEKLFEACFGFGYSDLRDHLSDYLPQAVRAPTRLAVGSLPPVPRVEVRPATPSEIARLRGEWERFAVAAVQQTQPEFHAAYLAQARRTLHRAYDSGDRDRRLLTTLGLTELDAGEEATALPLLEAAVAAGVARPRPYFELARVRLATLRRNQTTTKLFTYAELATVFEPLRVAAQQSPALPEVFALFAEAWARCSASPAARDWAVLERGARYFARRESTAFPLALAFARHGRLAESDALLTHGFDYTMDDAMRARFSALRAQVKAASAPR